MRVIEGVMLLRQQVHSDRRGLLVSLEEEASLPFPLERVFFMKVDRAGIERGGHANSCDEFILPLAGSVTVEVDNGVERAVVLLSEHDRGLWVQPGILIHLRAFERGTTLLVCASARYEDTRHYEAAQPRLAGPAPAAASLSPTLPQLHPAALACPA